MFTDRRPALRAAAFTLVLHAGALLLLESARLGKHPTVLPKPPSFVLMVATEPPPTPAPPEALAAAVPPPVRPEPLPGPVALPDTAAAVDAHPLASMAAPQPPSAGEWAFAARYTLKNSKGYRHSWGQQVRSMMGTAVEGPDQGMVRFRVEIAPDGRLQSLVTLWSTSAVAERLAREAIARLPVLPPTPTGQPLVFERTIAFSPFARDDPPLYRDDCLPDPPAFRNPFAWDGHSAPSRAAPTAPAPPDPQTLEECLRQLPPDSVEAETARAQRLMEQWGWQRPAR